MDFYKELVALARIKKPIGRDSYRVSCRGESLSILPLPIQIFLCQSKDNLEHFGRFKKIQEAILHDAKANVILLEATLSKVWAKTHKGACVKMETLSSVHQSNTNVPIDLKGYWICSPRSTLLSLKKNNPNEFFLFQILGLDVYSNGRKAAKVVDYFETSAHGIVVVQTTDDEEVMLPFVEKYIKIAPSLSHIEVQDFESFQTKKPSTKQPRETKFTTID